MIFQKAIFVISLLIVGCEESGSGAGGSHDPNITEITEWICTTDYIPPTIAVPDSISVVGVLTMMMPDTVSFFEDKPYNSLDECESICPDEPLEITTIYSPDFGEYFTMYCKNNN